MLICQLSECKSLIFISVAPKTGKQLLIDNKRAQNLGIFMSGLKNEGTRRLIDALNSVKEDETFPAEKLTTIRRCSKGCYSNII